MARVASTPGAMAAIIGLPGELYQAAVLDGASAFSRFRHLTLPLMRRILFFAVIVSTIWGLQVFDTALVLTNGGPGTATTTVIYRVWLYVFASNNKVGFASAISLVLILAILKNGVSRFDVPVQVQYILIGVIIIVNTALSRWQRRLA